MLRSFHRICKSGFQQGETEAIVLVLGLAKKRIVYQYGIGEVVAFLLVFLIAPTACLFYFSVCAVRRIRWAWVSFSSRCKL